MEASLASLDSYFRSNGQKINVSKFELLPIGTRQNLRNLPAFTVKFRGTDLAPCSELAISALPSTDISLGTLM